MFDVSVLFCLMQQSTQSSH